MPLHVPLLVHGVTIDTYIFLDAPVSELNSKATGLAAFLFRMPPRHVQMALANYRIFVIKRQTGKRPWRGNLATR